MSEQRVITLQMGEAEAAGLLAILACSTAMMGAQPIKGRADQFMLPLPFAILMAETIKAAAEIQHVDVTASFHANRKYSHELALKLSAWLAESESPNGG